MPIGTPVQRYAVNQANQTGTTTLSPASTVAAGTVAILCAVSSAKLISSVSDDAGNAWVVDSTFTGNGRSVSFASCQVGTQIGTSNVITITWNVATSTGTSLWVLEVSGLASSSAADKNASGTAGSGTAASAGPTATLSQAAEIAIAGFRASGAVSLTKGGSWSQPSTPTLNTNSAIEYQILASTNAVTADGTWGGSTSWAGLVQTYKGATGTTDNFTVTLAGTSSLSATAQELHQFTVTLAGTSSLAATVQELHRLSVTLAGTSALTAAMTELQRFTVSLAGTSSLSATAQELHRITVTLAGTSSLTATVQEVHPVTVTLAGTSSLAATLADLQRILVTLAGTSSLTATITGTTTPAPTTGSVGRGGALQTMMTPPRQRLDDEEAIVLVLALAARKRRRRLTVA